MDFCRPKILSKTLLNPFSNQAPIHATLGAVIVARQGDKRGRQRFHTVQSIA
jgi:hypothetical protein